MEDTGALATVPESLRYYFDYSSLARDMMLNGDVIECEYNGTTYIVSGV
jgi:antirestriction protein